jgi:hypothetical protein
MRRIFAIGFLPVLFGCAPSDWVSDSYATLEEAEADGLFARGWLPDLLPASATNIRTEINLDLKRLQRRVLVQIRGRECDARKTVRGIAIEQSFVRLGWNNPRIHGSRFFLMVVQR